MTGGYMTGGGGITAGGYSSGRGISSGPGITAGSYNNGPGISSGPGIIAGSYNNGPGISSGPGITAGSYNNGPGISSGPGITAGSYNNGPGISSGADITAGSYNNGPGISSGPNITTSGYRSGPGISSGPGVTASGYNVGPSTASISQREQSVPEHPRTGAQSKTPVSSIKLSDLPDTGLHKGSFDAPRGVAGMSPNLDFAPKYNNNCVAFLKEDMKIKLPSGLTTFEEKLAIRNVSGKPQIGDVAIIEIPRGEFASYGHLAVVRDVGPNSIKILEAHYLHSSVSERISTGTNFKDAENQLHISGYYRPSP
jgi:hypothetical protein